MSAKAAYLPEAEDDIDAAYAWYEAQRPGLGEKFLQALKVVVERIGENPHVAGVVHRDIRAALLRRFPYVVYYRAIDTGVLVIAVQHGRRRPSAWKRRA